MKNPKMTFGKYKDKPIYLIRSGYLRWLLNQDWFINKDDDMTVAVEDEIKERDTWNSHFDDDKFK